MEAKTSLLLAPVALCILLVLEAQGTGATSSIAVIFHGAVQCSNNPSTVVSNATLQVVINDTTVFATGQITSKGRFLITVNVTSDEQLISLVNNSSIKVVSTAPPNACGAPANAVAVLDEAPIVLPGYRFLGEISKAMILDFIRAISRHDLSSGPNGGRGQQNIVADDLTGAVDGHASIIIDASRRRDIVNEGLFVYVFSVAVIRA